MYGINQRNESLCADKGWGAVVGVCVTAGFILPILYGIWMIIGAIE